jgi:hypothetical protein
MTSSQPTPAEVYEEVGVGPVANDGPPERLYLDMVKRALCNLIYEDLSLWAYGPDRGMEPLTRFDLRLRVLGEDKPIEAHTMIGWQRLTNIESCAKAVIDDGIEGDFVETGVLRGGAAIFMRAVLKAYGVTDRRVFACDTFVAPHVPPETFARRLLRKPVLKGAGLLTRVPSRRWKLSFYRQLEKRQESWPPSANPSEEWVDFYMGLVRYFASNPSLIESKDFVSLAAVRSHFARYGLLDSQIHFLQGFFADTLPGAPIEAIALLRCDGDTYESTRSVLDAIYDKVSIGGYVIVDDYHSFDDCKQAVDEFRAEHSIDDALVPIDNNAVYWRRTQTRSAEATSRRGS